MNDRVPPRFNDELLYLSVRFARAVAFLLFGMTLVFAVIHFGVSDPAEQSPGIQGEDELQQKKVALGLHQPLSEQYIDYIRDMFLLDFGRTWVEKDIALTKDERVSDVKTIISYRLRRTAMLWLWTGLTMLGIIIPASLLAREESTSFGVVVGGLMGAIPTFLLALISETVFFNLGQFIPGLNWRTFLVSTQSTITRPLPVNGLGTIRGFLMASKLAFPPALALAIPLAMAIVRIWRSSLRATGRMNFVTAAKAKGLRLSVVKVKHTLPNAILPVVSVTDRVLAIIIGGTVVVEVIFRLEGLGTLLFISAVNYDYTTLRATVFVFLVIMASATFLQDVVYTLIEGVPSRKRRWRRPLIGQRTGVKIINLPLKPSLENVPTDSGTGVRSANNSTTSKRLRPLDLNRGFAANVRARPGPMALWLAGGVLLLALEFGAVVNAIESVVFGIDNSRELPTLLNRRLFPNTAHRMAGGGWTGAFLGLPPSYAWGIRITLVYTYAATWVGWLWFGYKMFKQEYRPEDWMPMDDVLAELRHHRLGQFGGLTVFVVVVAAIFAPTIGPMTLDRTNAHTSIQNAGPNLSGDVLYLERETGKLKKISVRKANSGAASTSLSSVGPLAYDKYGRFHPFGTTSTGTDLLTEMLHGARIYLLIAGGGALMSAVLAVAIGGLVSFTTTLELPVEAVASAIMMLPTLPFVIIISLWFYPELNTISTQLIIWAVLFGLFGWSGLWKVARPIISRARECQWKDASRAAGQSRLRVATRTGLTVVGPIFIYALIGSAGIIATTAALSYLSHHLPAEPYGLYEWGTLIWKGKNQMLSSAGHVFVVPAAMLVLLISGINALAAGLRDALAMERRASVSAIGEMGHRGGGG